MLVVAGRTRAQQPLGGATLDRAVSYPPHKLTAFAAAPILLLSYAGAASLRVCRSTSRTVSSCTPKRAAIIRGGSYSGHRKGLVAQQEGLG